MDKICLAHHLCPGDSLVLSAAIRSLHTNYPDRFLVDVDCTARELFDHNPDITKLDRSACKYVEVHYSDIDRADREPIHFMEAMCRGVSRAVGLPNPLQVNKPVLVLSEAEKKWDGVLLKIAPHPVPFAVLNAGGKRDYTTKIIGQTIAQEVLNDARHLIQFVQVGTSNELHPKLNGVVDLIDQTTIRDLIRVAWWSSFGIGPSTLLQHVYAALEKPYIAVLGGREPRSWTTYPTQIDLASHGTLPCCRTSACWRSRVEALNDNAPQDASLCALPVLQDHGEHVARCVAMLGSGHILQAIERLTFGGVV